MAQVEQDKVKWMQEMLTVMRSLRDEIRVDLHLAGMDAKTRWREELEPKLREAEKLATDLGKVSEQAMHEMVDKLRGFRETIRRH